MTLRGCSRTISVHESLDLNTRHFARCPAESHSLTQAAKPGVSPAGHPSGRPAIVGVAHIGLKTDNLAAARKFYTGVLGFQEPFSLDKAPGEGTGLLLTYFKVNDHQYIEMFPELTDSKMDRLSHISFETTNAEQMRAYLASSGVKVPDKLEPMQDGNRGFDVIDPDGHDVEFVEYRSRFPAQPQLRQVSSRHPHLDSHHPRRRGGERPRRGRPLLQGHSGIQMQWQGGMKDNETDWVAMRVPDGTDWLEYMLNVNNPDPHELGVMHHLCVGRAQHAGWIQAGD